MSEKQRWARDLSQAEQQVVSTLAELGPDAFNPEGWMAAWQGPFDEPAAIMLTGTYCFHTLASPY